MKKDQRYTLISICFLLLSLPWTILLPAQPTFAAVNTVTIHISGVSKPPGFNPYLLTVHMHDTIAFLNDAQPPTTYTIIANDHRFVSPPLAPGQQWETMLTQTGTYEYSAQGFSQQMVGTIIVASPSVQLLPTPAPEAIATEIAIIRAEQQGSSGQTGPKATPTTVSSRGDGSGFHPPILLLFLTVVGICLIVGIAIFLFRRKHASSMHTSGS